MTDYFGPDRESVAEAIESVAARIRRGLIQNPVIDTLYKDSEGNEILLSVCLEER